MSNEDHRSLIERFWHDLYVTRDYDKVGSYFADDGLYRDVPAPDAGARGPVAVAKRLKIGLEKIEAMQHEVHRMAADGNVVITEHTETWNWPTGERVSLPFCSVHEIRDGRIVVWNDYWDLATLMNAAPQWWLEHIMSHTEADFA